MPSRFHRTGVYPFVHARFLSEWNVFFADQVPDIHRVLRDHECAAERTDHVNKTGSYSDKKMTGFRY